MVDNLPEKLHLHIIPTRVYSICCVSQATCHCNAMTLQCNDMCMVVMIIMFSEVTIVCAWVSMMESPMHVESYSHIMVFYKEITYIVIYM